MVNVLITGSKGFIGSHMSADMKKMSFDHLQAIFGVNAADQINIFNIDISNGIEEDFVRWAPKKSWDYIIHTAAYVSVTEGERRPDLYYYNNVVKLADFLRQLTLSSFEAKFIFLSTGGALYGESENAREQSASFDNCPNIYAQTKYIGEQLVRKYMWNHLILRLANVYGPGEDERKDWNVFTHFRKDTPIRVYGDQVRHFVSLETVMHVVIKGIMKDIRGTYNIADDRVESIRELAEGFGRDRGVDVSYKDARPGEVNRIILNTDEAKRVGLL